MAVFYLYTRFITNNLLVEVTSTKTAARLFAWALKRQMFISFFLYCAGKGFGFRPKGGRPFFLYCAGKGGRWVDLLTSLITPLYSAGFITFVLGLKRGMYLYQFTQYAWTHMAIMVVIL